VTDDSFIELQRFPLLTDAGRDLLHRLREHPHGPRFNYSCGERLDAAGLENVRQYARALAEARVGWGCGEVPSWLSDFVRDCHRDVPFYRRRNISGDEFFSLPTIDRTDIRREPWNFVPDWADVSKLIVYRTSGTTGNLLDIISDPVAPNRYLPLMQVALTAHAVSIDGGNRVSIIQVASQTRTYTLASVMSFFDSAGFAKVNLNPADWNCSDDRARFLDDCNPEIYTGDPFAFEELARLPLKTRPKALISSATNLSTSQLTNLQSHFGCPVIDIYALNEAGPVAFSRGIGHEILPHNLYVEIFDAAGQPAQPGEVGEIVVTGGVNPNLPLMRYRTGDFAALDFGQTIPRLTSFVGRKPIRFRRLSGTIVNSIDVTQALFDIPLPFFSLHQNADRELTFRTRCDASTQAEVERVLHDLFGADQPFTIEQISPGQAWEGKWIQYRCDLSI
jgi:phenylacetate-CoA ligase